ncbi:F-box domain [Macleaya cordata]|uniref:F-box domain n=1 Tax=Macleaya cordata TaxID=56857 RepID=A0A200PPN6_MACCD|nr:F-box domain [Macleaya cordata]
MEFQTPDSSEEVRRNWLELPPDVMSLIFLKLGAIDILYRAQSVCSAWRKLSKEPQLWSSVDMRKHRDSFFGNEPIMGKMAREAVDRSCGQLVEFSVEEFATDGLLQYITDRCSSLRCLRLESCYEISPTGLIEMAKKLPLLEELELYHCSFSAKVLEVVGQLCPQLKSFRLNYRAYWHPCLKCDEKALAIAKSMPQLRHLHLLANKMSDNGLKAILDGCPHLESLDLRQCFNLKLEGDLLKRCADQIRNLRLPVDSPDGSEFYAQIVSDEYYECSKSNYFYDYDDYEDRSF